MRTVWLAMLLAVLAGCKNQRKEDCLSLLVEITDAEVNIEKARDDNDNKMKDVGKAISRESTALKQEKLKDETLASLRDDYASALDDYAEAYQDKSLSFDKWLKEVGKINDRRYDVSEQIVEHCRAKK